MSDCNNRELLGERYVVGILISNGTGFFSGAVVRDPLRLWVVQPSEIVGLSLAMDSCVDFCEKSLSMLCRKSCLCIGLCRLWSNRF